LLLKKYLASHARQVFVDRKSPFTTVQKNLRKKMRKKIWYTLITVVLMGLVVLVVLELLLRVIPGYSRNNLVFLDTAGYKIAMYEPNSEAWNLKERKNLVKFNDLGFHDIYQSHQKKEGEKVIGFIGDSFVECAQVHTDSTFTNLLRGKLEKTGKYKVYSLGISGTGTAYEYAIYNYFIKAKIKIDELYLCIFLGNDIDDNNPFSENHPNGYFVVDNVNHIRQIWKEEGTLKQFASWLRKRSYLVNTLYEMAFRFKRSQVHKRMAKTRENTPDTETNRQLRAKGDTLMVDYSLKLIEHWQQELEQSGVKMNIVFWDPELFMNDWQKKLMYDRTLELASKKDMKVITVNMKDNANTHFIHKNDDGSNAYGHYNEAGYREVADRLYEGIMNEASRKP
jgi:competence protein ComGC